MTTVDPRWVLMVQRSGVARMSMPLGESEVDCLLLLYAGVRTALGAAATGERVALAVPDENIVDVIETLLAGARGFFPERVGGLRLERVGSVARGPWVKLSHCGMAMFGAEDVVTHACCPSFLCKDMVQLVDGVLGEHTNNPAYGGDGGPCGWSGVGVVDDRADWMPAPAPASAPVEGAGERQRPWRRR